MPRLEKTVTITADGRDRGKVFCLREMSAMRADEWATRALLAMINGGADIPDDVAAMGMAGIARMGIKAMVSLNYRDLKPLLAEMMDCVTIMPDTSRSDYARKVIEDDIEEVPTLWRLRQEVLELHLGFSISSVLSKSTTRQTTDGAGPDTQTSQAE